MFKANVSLEIRASKEDIQKYIEGYMGKLPSFVKEDQELRFEIATGIADAVDGVYVVQISIFTRRAFANES
jgi:hypothetical protein